jgi:hypothetical protein
MYRKTSLVNLINSIEKIRISSGISEGYNFHDVFETGEFMQEGMIFINGLSGQTGFSTRIDGLISLVLSEIDKNEQSYWEQTEKEDYFMTILDFINDFNANCHYDPSTNSYYYEKINIVDQLKSPNLDDYFSSQFDGIHRIVFEKVFDLNIKLKKNKDFLELSHKKRKSNSGNNKIEWKLPLNQLVSFYFKQLNNTIETDRDNLKSFLLNNFTFKGKNLSENTLNTYFDPNREFEKLPKDGKGPNPTDFLD